MRRKTRRMRKRRRKKMRRKMRRKMMNTWAFLMISSVTSPLVSSMAMMVCLCPFLMP